MTTEVQLTGVETVFDIRAMTPEQLAQLGVSDIAYIKPIQMNGAAVFAIHAADGSPMAVTTERDTAIAAVVQHEMLPALVH